VKKFFIILGSIFLTLIVLGAIAIAFVAVRGSALDKESKAYADSAVPAIVGAWSEKALLDRASPEFKKVVTIDQLDRLFRWFSQLGALQHCDPAEGHSLMSATTQTGKTISAEYTAKATFQKGPAVIKLSLIKHGEQWWIAGFHIDSESFIPP